MTSPTHYSVSLNHTASQELQHHSCGCDGSDRLSWDSPCVSASLCDLGKSYPASLGQRVPSFPLGARTAATSRDYSALMNQ